MLEFVADTAREAGLEDYRVVVNVGPGWGPDDLPPALAHPRRADDGDSRMSLIARIEEELAARCGSATLRGATRCG